MPIDTSRPTEPRQLALQLDFPAQEPDASAVPTSAPAAASTPAPAPGAKGRRRIQLRQQPLEYALLRSKRRTIGFMIDEHGLRVTAPRWVSLGEIENAIHEKQSWILNKLNERRLHAAQLAPPMIWEDGASFPYLGRGIRLRIVSGQLDGVVFDEALRELRLCLPGDASVQRIKDRVLGWLQAQARALFAQRLELYAERLGVRYQGFALSSAQTMWGSCSANGRIRLNWRLMHFALEQIDYVVVHELSHLKEMNHSPRFWATVQSVFPEFENARKTLRQRGQETLPAF